MFIGRVKLDDLSTLLEEVCFTSGRLYGSENVQSISGMETLDLIHYHYHNSSEWEKEWLTKDYRATEFMTLKAEVINS